MPIITAIAGFAVGLITGSRVNGKKQVAMLVNEGTKKDERITELESRLSLAPLGNLKLKLGDAGIRAFRTLCAASTYAKGKPAHPLIFDMDDEKLAAIGLSVSDIELLEEAGAIKVSEADERSIICTQAYELNTPIDLGFGISACTNAIIFNLAGNIEVSVKPVKLNCGTDYYVALGLSGADLGVAAFTTLGLELAQECLSVIPPFGINSYIANAYSSSRRDSRHHFRSLDENGTLH